MKNFFSLLTILMLCTVFSGKAMLTNPEDTLVYVKGKVIDADNKQPVKSQITFESLPYFTITGFSESDQAYGKFEFFVLKGAKYTIKVQAEGYQTHYEEIDAIALTDTLKAEFALVPTGAGRLMRLDKLIFELGSYKIAKESYEELDGILRMLNENPKMVIQLEGHTDFSGNADSNMRLSERRVESVRNYLIEKGVDKSRIKAKAFGGTQPLSRENTEEARALNRRVEVRIIKN